MCLELGPKVLTTLEEAWVTFELYPCAWWQVDGNIDQATDRNSPRVHQQPERG